MRHRIRQQQTRLVRRLALGNAIAAIVVPGGIASARPPSTPIDSERERHATASPAQLPTLEKLEQFRFTPGDVTVATLPSLFELEGFRFQPAPVETLTAARPADGIDWVDAGIGAGIGIAAALLAAAAALAVHRRQRPAHS
jgi:hypothetical protein